MSGSAPPAYAWDWFSRQRLLWREARTRLAASDRPHLERYRRVSAKPDVVPMLRADYPDDVDVRAVVRSVIDELVFLGRTDRPFADLAVRNAPRGLRWWWRELTGEEVDAPPPATPLRPGAQLRIDDVLRGYGD